MNMTICLEMNWRIETVFLSYCKFGAAYRIYFFCGIFFRHRFHFVTYSCMVFLSASYTFARMECPGLQKAVDESMLTGESVPVQKLPREVKASIVLCLHNRTQIDNSWFRSIFPNATLTCILWEFSKRDETSTMHEIYLKCNMIRLKKPKFHLSWLFFCQFLL